MLGISYAKIRYAKGSFYCLFGLAWHIQTTIHGTISKKKMFV